MTARQQDRSRAGGQSRSAATRVFAGFVVALAALCAGSSPAFAGVGVSVLSTVPSPQAVGNLSQPAALTITNNSSPPESSGTITLCAGPSSSVQNTCASFGLPGQSLLVTPSCGSTALGQTCAAGAEDAGVFKLSATGTGEAGTACAGAVFDITTVNASSGQVAFIPGSTVVLGAPGGSTSVCRIDYTFDVLKRPAKPLEGTPGTTEDLASGAGFSDVSTTAGSGFGNTTVTIDQATVPVATQVSPATIQLGGTFSDTATLTTLPTASPQPTGTVTFDVYANDPTCSAGSLVATSTNPISAGSSNATSTIFTAATTGTYRVTATYSGDANYNPVQSSCQDPSEAVVVNQAALPITTQVSPSSIALGASFSDTATLGAPPAGAPAPTGSVAFKVYAPGDASCTSPTPVFTSTNPVSQASGTATSSNFTPTTPGAYQVVAVYSGDANYTSTVTNCADSTESVFVNGGAPTVATGAAASVSNTEETIQGSVNPNGSPTSYTVEYGPTLSFGAISQVNGAGSGPGTFTGQVADLSGLSPNATYFYRLVATNAIGTSSGTVMTFTTSGPAGGSPPMVTTGAATDITSSAATLSGTISPGELQTGFTFEYGTTTEFGNITVVDALIPSGVLQPVSLPVSGLLPNTFYVYRLVASNSAGTSTGAVAGFTTAGP